MRVLTQSSQQTLPLGWHYGTVTQLDCAFLQSILSNDRVQIQMALSDAPSPLDSLRSTVHHFGNYRLLEPLNRGASGYVYRIQSLRSQRILALKVLEKKTVTYDRIRSEIEMQTEAQGPGILQLESTFEDAQNCYMVLQLCPKDLSHLLRSGRRVPESQAKRYILQVAEGLAHIHSKGIVHRDIKPQNLLLDHEANIRICDFGFAGKLSELKGFYGTLNYIAPEILLQLPYDQKVDCFSLGCVAYILLLGRLPFEYSSYEQAMQRIKQDKIQIPDFLSYQARSFLIGSLRKNPAQRLSASELAAHPFLSFNRTQRFPVNQRLSNPTFFAKAVDPQPIEKAETKRISIGEALPPINLEGVKPVELEIAQGKVVVSEGSIQKISSSGLRIKVDGKSVQCSSGGRSKTYLLGQLPGKYHKVYLYLHQISEVLRSNTLVKSMATASGEFKLFLDGHMLAVSGPNRLEFHKGEWKEQGDQKWVTLAKSNLQLLQLSQ